MQEPLPKLTALLKNKQAKKPANPLDELDPSEFAKLQEMAEKTYFAGDGEPAAHEAGEAPGQESAEHAHAEPEESPKEEAAEGAEEQAREAAAGEEQHSPQDYADMAGAYVDEIQGYLDMHKADPEAAQKFSDLLAIAQTAKEQTDAAAASGGVQEAAEAASAGQEACEAARALHEPLMAGKEASKPKPPPYGKPAPPKAPEKKANPLAMWAGRAG